MGELYTLTSPSGKRYIGWTAYTAARRFSSHVRAARKNPARSSALRQAILKYGEDAFIVQTLVIADDREFLKKLECAAIAAFGTIAPRGYNLTPGGDGVTKLVGAARG